MKFVVRIKIDLFLHTCSDCDVILNQLRNESNITKKGRKTAPMRVAKVFRSFFDWYLDQPKKFLDLYFLSFNFHFISTKKSVILTLINAGLFQTFDVVEIHVTSQYSFRLMQESPQFFNQSEQALLNHSNKYQMILHNIDFTDLDDVWPVICIPTMKTSVHFQFWWFLKENKVIWDRC